MAGIDDIRLSVPYTYIGSENFAEGANVSEGLLIEGLGVYSRRVPHSKFQDKNCFALEAAEKLRNALGHDYMQKVRRVGMSSETDDFDSSKPGSSIVLPLLFGDGNIREIFEDPRTYPVQVSEGKFACLHGLGELTNYLGKKTPSLILPADISEYDMVNDASAEGTAGAGAAAIAVGEGRMLQVPDFIVEGDLFGYSSSHTHDFSKPVTVEGSNFVSSKYPLVDGKFSFLSYLKHVGEAYKDLKGRLRSSGEVGWAVDLDSFKGVVMHVPYPKMTEYALKYLRAIDVGEDTGIRELLYSVKSFDEDAEGVYEKVRCMLKEFAKDERYADICKSDFKEKLADSLVYPSQVGNTYTASVFFSLVSSLENGFKRGHYFTGDRILVLGYGSGGGSIALPFVVTDYARDIVGQGNFGKELKEGKPLAYDEFVGFRSGESPYATVRGFVRDGTDTNGKTRYVKVGNGGEGVVYGGGGVP